ncbi:hypothetical protein [Vibrio vulnificus]|uniref:hypothetical protein n=1 Tax=Vibrio vulnificus TaxID=672 RepID=UPI000CD140E0|nr:hypothetical protein [Vibrio vulnificus]EHH1187499.1 hypothetical protein [Vibrio vulnificus]EIZ1284539.1 hypothetical protein [Vibrio vulnificus]EKE1121018.1 hypothetical protein [Vibrio vulnificus]EME0140698.1 hypothetical protein [Vibrio vulnificus]MCU8221338.1 hypothetical protein [Vibrio vulnificus]
MSNNLKEILLNEDDIGRVIKSHIYMENLIYEFIDHLVVDSQPLKAMNLDYYSAIHLAVSLGLPKKLLPPLKCLGSIRNSFAHRVGQKLSKNEINAMYKSFSQSDKLEFNEQMALPCFSWVAEGKTWRDNSVKMQYVMLFMHLIYLVEAASILVKFQKVL